MTQGAQGFPLSASPSAGTPPYQTCTSLPPASPIHDSDLFQPPSLPCSQMPPLTSLSQGHQLGPETETKPTTQPGFEHPHVKSEFLSTASHSSVAPSPHTYPPTPHHSPGGGAFLSLVGDPQYPSPSESPQPHQSYGSYSTLLPHAVSPHLHQHYTSYSTSPHPHSGQMNPHAHGPPQHPPTPTSQSHESHGSPSMCAPGPPGAPCPPPPQHHMNHPPHAGYMPPTSIAPPPVSSADHMALPPPTSSPGLANAHHWEMKPPASAPYMYSWYAPDQQHLLT